MRARSLSVLGAAAAGGFVLTALGVAVGALQDADVAGTAALGRWFAWARPETATWASEAARDMTALGSGTALTLAALVAAALAAAAGRGRIALALPASFLLASGANLLLKGLSERARPSLVEDPTPTFTHSFPSGHAFLTTAVAVSLALVFGRCAAPAVRRAALVAAAVLAGLVGLSRVALGVHWPSDVVAGWCLGLAWASVTTLAAWRLDGTLNGEPRSPG
jgi:undecaprenyl-diphosphatase